MKYLQIVFTMLFFASITHAQDTLKVIPGDKVINGSFIKPYTNKWEVYIQTPEGNETHIRYWTDYVHILEQDGKAILHRVQDLYGPDRSFQSTWVNVVEHESLIPIRFTSHAPGGALLLLQFENEEIIVGSNQAGTENFSSDTTKTDQLFFDWNLYGMLLVGLPFEEGKTFELPFWSAQMGMRASVFATIGKQEQVKTLSGKKYDVVSVSTSDGFTFSLSKEAPYVLKLVWKLPNGNTMVWKTI